MVDTLATMIKPAVPTPNTRLLIEGAAREWGHTVCIVLKQHYEDCPDALLGGSDGPSYRDLEGGLPGGDPLGPQEPPSHHR